MNLLRQRDAEAARFSKNLSVKIAREIVFIDPAVADHRMLATGVRHGLHVVVLDAHRAAFEQIADALSRNESYTAVHIVAHGAPGEIAFASGPVSHATIDHHAGALAAIGAALAPNAEILLWACAAGKGAQGRALIDGLAKATGADVGAATHLVGAAEKGGAWTLDAGNAAGEQAPFTREMMAGYRDVLATRLWYVTSGEQQSEAGLSAINSDGSNQQIDFVSDTVGGAGFGLGTSWVETVADPSVGASGVYYILEQNIFTGGGATLYLGTLGSAAVPTAVVTFTNTDDVDILGGLQIDTVNHHIYIGYTDYDNNTNFNLQPATTGIIQMDYNASTGAVTNTSNYLVNEQDNPIPGDAFNLYAPIDFALGDGSLFFVQQELQAATQIYRVNLTSHAVTAVLDPGQFNPDWSDGVVNDVEIDTANHLLFFSVHDENQPGTHNGVYYISDSASGGTATQLTLPGISANFSPNNLLFDQTTRVIYVTSEETSDGPGNGVPDDIIYAFQVNGTGTAATFLSTITVGFGDDPAGTTANIGGMFLVQNVAPTLTGLDPATFAENTVNATPQIIDSAVVFNDTDDTNYTGGSMTVSYSVGGSAQDNLSIHNFGGAGIGVSGSNITFGGVTFATFTGGTGGTGLNISFTTSTASPTSIDTLIQALQYQNTSDTPTATRTISIVVTDPSGGTNSSATSLITVNAENDSPVISNLDASTSTDEQTSVIIDGNVTVSDPELAAANNYAGATLTITPSADAAHSNFFFVTTGALFTDDNVNHLLQSGGQTFATYGVSAGVLSVNFTSSGTPATTALVNDVLQHINYINFGDNPPASVQLAYSFNDGNTGAQGSGGIQGIATASITVNITQENDAPDLTVPVGALSGTAGNPIALTGITFSDSDDGGASEVASFSSTTGTLSTDVVAGITVGGSGAPGGTLTLTGTISAINSYIAAGHLKDTTAANDTIHAFINDQGHTGAPGALQSATKDISVSVNAPPSTPTDNDNTANAVTEGAPLSTLVGITANSTDSDGGTVTYSLTVNPGNFFQIDQNTGVVSVSATGAAAGGIDYESAPGHAYSITVQADDGQGGLTTQAFSIAVNDVAPSAPADNNGATNTVVEGALANTAVGITALATDINGGTPTYALTNNANGAFQIDSTTGVVTVADPSKIDYESTGPGHTLTITVQASDGTLSGATQDFTIAVTDANPSAPTDSDGTANAVTEGAAAGTAVHITAASTDPNGPAVTYSLTNDAGGFFQIDSGTGVVTVTSAGATGINYETAPGHAYSIAVTASDGAGGTSTNTFSIAVNDVAPGATGDSYTVNEDTALSPVLASGVLANDSDVNGGPITAALDTGPAHAASFTLNADGTFSYTAAANYNGPDSFTYHATDGALSSGIVTVSIGVNPVNDVPTLNGLGDSASFTENGSSVRLDTNTNATVSDVELDASATHYAGATLTLARNGGANPDDTFAGTGALDLADSNGLGENVSLNNGATFIGTYSQPGDGTFSIVFNANADATAVNTVMHNIVFFNASDNPPASEQINFTFSDGNGDPGGQAQGSGATPGTVTGSTTVNITQVDDAPVLLSVAPSALYGIGSSGVVLSLGLQAFDPDATAPSPNIGLASATVKISVGFVATDQLFVNLATSGGHFVTPDGDTTNISISSNAGGTLVLSGTDSVAHYQAILDAVSYRSTAADPTGGGADPNRTITWQVSDGVLTNQNPNPPPAPAFPETILGFDAPPTVDLSAGGAGTGFTTTFQERGAPVKIVATDVSIADPDNAALTTATIVLTNAQHDDSLSIIGTLPVGIDSAVDTSVAGKITITLSGSASLADYQTALGDIVFSTSGANPSIVPRDITVTVNDGDANSNTAHATVNVAGIPPKDFDFNSTSDVLWQNHGFVSEWLMNNSQIGGNVGVGMLDASWHFLDTGDFNADGHADALWQNDSGQVVLWTLNGPNITGNQTVGTLDSHWHNEGAGDFNGDGHSDVLWLNDSGQVVIWTMNGAQITGNQTVATITPDLHISGILDTGTDGNSDILLRSTNGQVSLWTMNGANIASNNLIANVGLDWNVAGTGDFNGDGHEDILWRNDSGQVVLWTMNGTQITSNTSIATVTNDWHIMSVGDYNHDGNSDVLWRNDSGQVVMWEMNGSQIVGNHTVTYVGGGAAPVANDWTILTHHYDVL